MSAQTRGWFYTLMVLSTALFDKAPFRNCICHGVVLDENKQKLSKRLKNYPDPVDVFDTYGADALRWYMISSPLLSGGDLAMPKDGRAIGETVRAGAPAALERLFVLHALRQYRRHQRQAGHDRPRPSSTATSSARPPSWSARVEAAMDRLDIAGACNALPPFIEALNNWYIRRSRERFWKAEKDADKRAAYDTLYTVLVTLCRTMAPFLPLPHRAHPPRAGRRRERASAGLAGCVGVRGRSRRWSSAWTSPARSARRRPRSARRRTSATACRSAS